MGFFSLPRELRDAVYEFYVAQPEALRYFPDDDKLRTHSGDVIDLSLNYVCNQAAVEMRGLVFRHNTIEFVASLHGNPATVTRATRFHHMVHDVHQIRLGLLDHCRSYITAEIIHDATTLFPYCASLLPVLANRKRSCLETPNRAKDWGTIPSTHRDLITFVIQQIEKQPGFPGFSHAIGDWINKPSYAKHADHMHVLAQSIGHSWEVPTDTELDQIEEKIPGLRGLAFDSSTRYERCFSAAALAARFLARLPRSLRVAVSHIVLREIHIGAGYTESHAKALIPFCIDNPKLRIKRRVDLWQNVLPGYHSNCGGPFLGVGYDTNRGNGLRRRLITETIATWIEEALVLPAAGMPAKCFSLVFDGTADNVQPIISVIKEDAAWQDALESCFRRQSIKLPAPSPDNCAAGYRGYPLHISEGFPSKLADILAGNSFISFSEASPEPLVTESVIHKNRACATHEAWMREWKALQPTSLDPVEPLPSWKDIRAQYRRNAQL